MPDDELIVDDKPLWYLLHHPVFNKPGKTRVVFGYAATCRGRSLNDQLLSGLDLTNSIVGVLSRFRVDPVALAADVECIFHQVRVPPADRDAFRFLWWPDSNLNQDPADYRMEVHLLWRHLISKLCQFCFKKDSGEQQR